MHMRLDQCTFKNSCFKIVDLLSNIEAIQTTTYFFYGTVSL